MLIVTEVPFGTLTTLVPPVVVKSSVPTVTSIVALPSVTVSGSGGPLVGVGSSSTVVAEPAAVLPGDPLPDELPLLDPQAVSPMARHTASGPAGSLIVRPVARRIASLLSGRKVSGIRRSLALARWPS
jgi:hypothetical protein